MKQSNDKVQAGRREKGETDGKALESIGENGMDKIETYERVRTMRGVRKGMGEKTKRQTLIEKGKDDDTKKHDDD